MSDSGDNSSSDGVKPPRISDEQKAALKAKLQGLKKLPPPKVPAPKPAEDPDEGLEELSLSDAEPEAADGNEFRFELADLGVDASQEAPAPTHSTIDPALLQPAEPVEDEAAEEPVHEPHIIGATPSEVEEFEDEKTQLAEGLSFEGDSEGAPSHEGLDEISDFEVGAEPQKIDDIQNKAAESIELVRQTASSFQIQAPLPEPIRSPDKGLPEPIHRDPPVGAEPIPDDEDFQSQKTEMLSSPFESDGLVAKLRVIEGPDTGQEFFVGGMRNTIGRGDMNSVMVADAAMSRQHIEILRNEDDTFLVRDLQSVNGTSLNGTRIREADLFHGDRLEAGQSVLQFVLQGDVAPPTRNRRIVPAALSTMQGSKTALHDVSMPPPNNPETTKKLFWYVGGIGIVLCLILIGGLVFIATNTGPKTGAETTQLTSQLYLEGVEALKQRDWELARTKFSKAKELDPALSVDRQLGRIDDEMAALEALNRAKDLHADGKLDEAAARAAAIPESSVYYEESRTLAKKQKSVEVDSIYADAQDMVANDDFEGARKLIVEIRERVPTHQGAKDLEEQIKRLELERETAQLEEDVAQARREKNELARFAPRPKKTAEPSDGSRVINFTKGYRLYRDKKFDAAVKFFEDSARSNSGAGAKRAKNTAKAIKTFQSEYRAAKLNFAKRDWASAEKSLLSARRTDSDVSGGKGYHSDELSTLLASSKGQLGLAALSKKDYAKAYKYQKQGERYSKNDDAVRKLKKSLESEARNLYVKAANKRKTDARAAAKLCRQIKSMVPKSNDTYQKADKLLKEM